MASRKHEPDMSNEAALLEVESSGQPVPLETARTMDAPALEALIEVVIARDEAGDREMPFGVWLEVGTDTPIHPFDPRLKEIGFIFDYVVAPDPQHIDPDKRRWRKLRWQVVYHRHTRMAKDEEGNQLFDEQGKERRETIETYAYTPLRERPLDAQEAALWTEIRATCPRRIVEFND